MKVKPAAVFPLDVYFLMDLSRSMEDDLRSLQQLANSTSQYRPLLTYYVHIVCSSHTRTPCNIGLPNSVSHAMDIHVDSWLHYMGSLVY